MLHARFSRRTALRLLGGAVLGIGLPGCSRTRSTEGPEQRMRTVRVTDEFGALRTALVHDASNARTFTMEDHKRLIPPDQLRDHPETGPSSRNRLIEQHAGFRQVLADHGVTLLSAATQADAFCQVFTRDPCFAIGDTLFVGSLRDDYRHRETAGLAQLRREVGKEIDLSGDGAWIEGGDVMVLDQGRVLVGMNRHTNEAGCGKLANHLVRSGVDVIRVPHRALHLDCCLAPLPNGEALYCESKLPEPSVKKLRECFAPAPLIRLDPNEAELHLAANMFWINERKVVSNAKAVKTNGLLRKKGYEVIDLDFSHLVHLWGSFRCVVCPLERA